MPTKQMCAVCGFHSSMIESHWFIQMLMFHVEQLMCESIPRRIFQHWLVFEKQMTVIPNKQQHELGLNILNNVTDI